AARLAGALAADGVVPRMPSEPRAVRTAEGASVQHRLRAPRQPDRARHRAREEVQRQDPDHLLRVPPMSDSEIPAVPVALELPSARNRREARDRRYWKSLDEVAETPGFLDYLHREFPEQASMFE